MIQIGTAMCGCITAATAEKFDYAAQPVHLNFWQTIERRQQGLSERKDKSPGVGKVIPRSVRWLCVQYFKSAMFKELDPRTQKVRRAILERFCKHKSDGDKPFALLQPRHVRIRRDEMSDCPEAANSMVKAFATALSVRAAVRPPRRQSGGQGGISKRQRLMASTPGHWTKSKSTRRHIPSVRPRAWL